MAATRQSGGPADARRYWLGRVKACLHLSALPDCLFSPYDGLMMPTPVALFFRAEIEALQQRLDAVSPDLADTPWKPGKWTRKQIVGHLLDSAANNRQRFVRAALDGAYAGPKYAQDGWVAIHGYADQTWEVLLEWWRVEHQILASVVDRIAVERLQASCTLGYNAPVTLQFLIEDYVAHQQWHMRQIDGQGPVGRP